MLSLVRFCVVVALVGVHAEARCGRSILWTGGPFGWPCASKSGGRYISKNVLATRAAIYQDDVILALPRFRSGVPATLARFSLRDKNCRASLSPFPCWSLQEEGTCSALQNVVDLYLDPQDILWVLDTGVVNSLETAVRKCPPKVVALNLRTGKVLRIIDLSDLTSTLSRLQYVVADCGPDGRIFVYVSDAAMGAILVYDVTSDQGYRFVLPQSATVNRSREDVLYLALMRRRNGSGRLIFTYRCGGRVFSVDTSCLKKGSPYGGIRDLGPKPRRMVVLGTDNGNALFFRFEGNGRVYRWDSDLPFAPAYFRHVYRSKYKCNLATHVAADRKRGRMRVLESNLPDYMLGAVGFNGVNHALRLM